MAGKWLRGDVAAVFGRWRAVAVTLALLFIGSTAGLPAQLPLFQSRTDLVMIDVSVLDRERRPVRGLTAGDFVVLEEGKIKPIIALAEANLPSSGQPVATERGTSAFDALAKGPASEGRLIAIVLDRTIRAEDLGLARRIASEIVDGLSPSDLAALVFTSSFRGNGRAVDYTSDHEKLLQAIRSPIATTPHATSSDPFNYNGVMIDDPDGYQSGDCRCGACVPERLAKLADDMRAVRGRRKLMFFIGTYFRGVDSGLASRPGGSRAASAAGVSRSQVDGGLQRAASDVGSCSSYLADAREKLIGAARLSNVVIYTLDPTGLETHENSPLGGGMDGTTKNDFIRIRQNALSLPADWTGGRTILNTNEPYAEIPTILEETRSYYIIGIEPLAASNKVRRLNVKVTMEGATVLAPSGYVYKAAR